MFWRTTIVYIFSFMNCILVLISWSYDTDALSLQQLIDHDVAYKRIRNVRWSLKKVDAKRFVSAGWQKLVELFQLN